MKAKQFFTTRGIILLALTATVGLSFISYRSIVKLNSLSGWVDHTHVVQLNLQRTYSALSDADSELKAFLITKDSSYYANLKKEKALIAQSVTDLKSLTSDNPLQNKRVYSLDSLVAIRVKYMDSILKSDKSQYDALFTDLESCNMLLRKKIQILIVEEDALLDTRSQDSAKFQTTAPFPLLAVQVLIAVCLLIGFFRVTDDLRIKEHLQLETLEKNKELKSQRDFIQGIFENTVDVIIIFDTQLNMIAMNKRARELYDPTGTNLGKNVLQIYPQSRGSDVIKGINAALDGKHTHNAAFESVVYKGTFYESFFVPLYASGKVNGAMVIHHDVSDLIKMTTDIQKANQQLQKNNHELEQFAYVTSHDLQEPLRKIRTFADMAKRNINNAENVTKNLDKVSASAERMSILIKDILNYSRLSTIEAMPEEVDLNEVLDQVLQDFELTINDKDAVIESTILPKVSGSKQQLTQVFFNIISNSLKFCKSLPSIKINCRHGEGYYDISFTDNGIGFEQTYAEQIFGVFQRLHHSHEFNGTGIGLALCKRIVENHGGTIKATSALNKGTTITLTLPEISKKRKKAVLKLDGTEA